MIRAFHRPVKAAMLIATPLEVLCLWGAYFWIHFGLQGHSALAQYTMLAAFVIHIPPLTIASFFVYGDGVAFWSMLFLGGYIEWFLLVAAVTWGYREAKRISTPVTST